GHEDPRWTAFGIDWLRDRTPTGPRLFLKRRPRRGQIAFEQIPQFTGYFRFSAEPELKAAHRLVQQHAEPVGGAQAARSCSMQQRRNQPPIHALRTHSPTVQTSNVPTAI